MAFEANTAIAKWYRDYDNLSGMDKLLIKSHIGRLKHKPRISLLTPVYNTKGVWLRKCIESVLVQLYDNWELCLCDNASNPETTKIIAEYVAQDSRIKSVRLEQNQGGYGGTNAALDISTGDYIGFLDSDDEITQHALYLIAELINRHPDTDWIYTDEAIINEEGACIGPFFKPDYAPDLFMSQFYMSHLSMYRAEIIKKLRLRESAGSHDYDLALRVSDIITPKTIHHIPVLAYRYRRHGESLASNTESYCVEGAIKSLREHFDRVDRKVTIFPDWPHYRVQYQLESYPHVDICIASINKKNILDPCLTRLMSKTDYPNYSIVLCVPEAVKSWVIRKLGALVDSGKIRFAHRSEDPTFNYSILANSMNKVAGGPILCFYNDDLEPINNTWLNEMVALAVHPETGAVGSLLLYTNNTIQHAGCILGLEGSAAHIYKKAPKTIPGYLGRAKLIGNYSMVTGACLTVRKEVYEEVGGYDENYQVAYGDVDLCLKMVEAGYYNAWTPQATLFHAEAFTRGIDSTPEQQQRFAKETDMIRARWGQMMNNDPMYNPNLSLNSYHFELPQSLTEIRYKKPWLK